MARSVLSARPHEDLLSLLLGSPPHRVLGPRIRSRVELEQLGRRLDERAFDTVVAGGQRFFLRRQQWLERRPRRSAGDACGLRFVREDGLYEARGVQPDG